MWTNAWQKSNDRSRFARRNHVPSNHVLEWPWLAHKEDKIVKILDGKNKTLLPNKCSVPMSFQLSRISSLDGINQNEYPCNFAIQNIVIILDCISWNWCAHVSSNLCYLTSIRDLISSKAVINRIFFIRKDLFSINVRNMLWATIDLI